VTANAGWVNAGTDRDTAAFAVERSAAAPSGEPSPKSRTCWTSTNTTSSQPPPHPACPGRAC